MDVEQLKRILIARAIDHMAANATGGCEWMESVLKAKVGGTGGGKFQGRAVSSPFLYTDENGKVRRGRRGAPWQPGNIAFDFNREGPPGKRSGAGQASIGYQLQRLYSEGRLRIKIGVDNSAPGGFRRHAGYLLGWEEGIRYPDGRGGWQKAGGTGTVRQKPWFYDTIESHKSALLAIILT